MLVDLFVVFVFSFLCTALQQQWLVTDLLQEQMSVEVWEHLHEFRQGSDTY